MSLRPRRDSNWKTSAKVRGEHGTAKTAPAPAGALDAERSHWESLTYAQQRAAGARSYATGRLDRMLLMDELVNSYEPTVDGEAPRVAVVAAAFRAVAAAPLPLYLRVAVAVRAARNVGHLDPGDRLPPAGQLADACGCTQNVVFVAYRELVTRGYAEHNRAHSGYVVR